jgi:hypothetical protein
VPCVHGPFIVATGGPHCTHSLAIESNDEAHGRRVVDVPNRGRSSSTRVVARHRRSRLPGSADDLLAAVI